jgi:aspartyl-tRNA(Asn)/glutamyl-tRNA(Gln) amidotransferase subunit B
VKNVTGMKNLLDAARYEVQRQEKLVKAKQGVVQETRSYVEKDMKTAPSREKESDEEYGFIFDPDLASYKTTGIRIAKPVYASKIAKEYSKRYGVKDSALRELIMFNSGNLALIDSAKDRHGMKALITAVELLQRYASKKADPSVFERVVEIVEKGAYPDKEMMLRIEAGKSVEVHAGASDEEIDNEIKRLIGENSKLLKELGKNPKAFNFVVGAVIKKYKSNPRAVSERLERILKELE